MRKAFILFLLWTGLLWAGKDTMLLDMVHHNPGEPQFDSKFNDPAFLKSLGYDSKVFALFESAQLGVNWDSVNPKIFPAGSPDRIWLDAKRQEITEKYNRAKDAGLKVFCMSDLILFPKRLVEQNGMQNTFKNATDAKTQEVLRTLVNLMFDQYPQLDGIVVRIGETYLHGAPYHVGGIDNKTDSATIIALMQLLREEICVKRSKVLIFRTWMSFDENIDIYMKVSDAVEPDEKLIISVKHCEGDFHRGNRFGRVLGQGRHQQVVEVQCQREYEGKGAYPNYICNGVIDGFEEYKYTMSPSDMQSLREFSKTPLYRGLWTWSRGGGWDGPYLTKGIGEIWCELNIRVMSKWAKDPTRSEEELFNEYATTQLGLAGDNLAKFRKLCLLSADAVIRGKRSTHNDISPWWSRDHFIGHPPLPTDSTARQRVIDQKHEAAAIWGKIVDLADQISFADPNVTETVRVSCRYGWYLYRIYQIAFDLALLENDYVGKQDKIDSLLAEYDQVWHDYKQLKIDHPACASLYTELKFRNEQKDSLAEFIKKMRNLPDGKKVR